MIRMIMSRLVRFFSSRVRYIKDKKTYNKLNKSSLFLYCKQYENKRLYDRYDNAGSLDEHYFLQDLYFAKKIIQKNIKNHHDVGSRIDGFLAHLLSAGINVNMIDIRPLPYDVPGLSFVEGNATKMDLIDDGSIESLSSLHAIEHFGLGRYGDPIDPNGWKKALCEYTRVLKKGGTLFLSVPIGKNNKLCFNAHRVFKPATIVKACKGLKLEEFSYIKDMKLYIDKSVYEYNEESDYLCGLFVFTK